MHKYSGHPLGMATIEVADIPAQFGTVQLNTVVHGNNMLVMFPLKPEDAESFANDILAKVKEIRNA